MAADFSTAPAVVSPPAFQQHAYKTSAPYTPMTSGTTTPANVSPTSPRNTSNLSTLHLHMRPPKSPLYVPAVLRPTEKPARQSPPKNADSGLDSADSSWSASGRRATGDSLESGISRVVTEEWNEEIQGPVTGPPSRNHWKPDNSTSVCSASACHKPFSFFDRRHHCRRCGGIFCGAHSLNNVRLNQHALFHPSGSYYRACDRCFSNYRDWESRRKSIAGSENSGSSNAVCIDSPTAAKRPDALRVGSLASSVPSNWAWSTF
ncbi:FYVE-domain-containing protein [Cenococcum geophilum 1.58]|uniref:FYVE-domain-containing protein n=1 Tax=Cenococcum geophilum 1.58 TaxID=794803 RepID=UPI0035900D70|nr:FYVE-domain-containing protein [Cenococcum geophilum 1.58]